MSRDRWFGENATVYELTPPTIIAATLDAHSHLGLDLLTAGREEFGAWRKRCLKVVKRLLPSTLPEFAPKVDPIP